MNYNIFYQSFPEIRIGDDLSLRKISPHSDTKNYYDYMSSKDMKQFLCADHIPINIEAAYDDLLYWHNLYSEKRSIFWAIADSNNKLIGTGGFNHISFKNGRAEISYDLDPNYWGMGYMSRAIKAILDFAEFELELVRVQATVDMENPRSIKLLERCGFAQEGILHQYEIVGGKHKDYYMYSKIFNQ